MTLSAGASLGPYEILSPLGAGGMGEVYRAKDTRLGRTVALKVLPDDFLEDEERRLRFEREARTLASLNHPGIAAIYSFEEVPGSSPSSPRARHILVMELVEGEGLDRKISSGPLPLEECLSYAAQIAEALSAAHEKGIVHRDLKPANVMVSNGGRVKILDFGLARAAEPASGSGDTEETLQKLTHAGTIVGTIPYMSPEQIEGRPLGPATDVFSLGVVLYEMATGERPFSGGSSPALMSSILRDEPLPVATRRPDAPDGLSRLVGRCLAKRPGDRIQTASEILGELSALRRARESGAGMSASEAAADSSAARADEGFWVAVLPFKYSGANSDLAALAEALSEEIVTGLSRFSYLRVVSRSTTSRYAHAAVDVRTAGREIGARYVVEGSLRQSGARLRLAVQLVDASSGTHLWAESYERAFSAEEVFALQDDLVPRVVSTCADHFGVLARSISDAVRGKGPARLSPYEALMRGFGYHQRLTPEEHAEAREALERAVAQAPANADCWAMLSWVYSHEFAHGFNVRPGSLERALAAARRAVDIAPSNHLAHQALAVVLFFRKETAGCLSAAERAVALNPLDGSNEAIFLITFSGDWERGCTLIRRAMELNPHHPRWYGVVLGMNEYRVANYRAAVEEVVKASAPDVFWTNAMLAAAHGQLGELAAAGNALRDLLAQKEDFARSAGPLLEKWFDPQLAGRLLEGLRKAGLDAPSPARADAAAKPAPGVAIAVLPFTDMSAAKDQDWFCEGMAEEIMNALVRVPGIRVASRTSAFRARQDGADLPAIARALSVGHVLEGSVRTAGDRLRVTARLTDVASGYQLWSERFDRETTDVFAVQDEIARGVVEAVKARLSSGEHPVPARPRPVNLEAYRSYLKGRHLRAVEDAAGALSAFQEAVRLDPAHAPSWTGLAEITVFSAHMGMIMPLAACTAARKMLATAKELQEESAEGLHVEAFAAYLERRWDAMESAWRRALELQPDHVLALGSFGISLCARQRLEEALPLFERARQADPLASFPYNLAGWGLLMCGRPQEALRQIEQALTFQKEDATAIGALCIADVALGRFDEAIAAGERGVAVMRRAPVSLGLLGWALATAGRDGEARTVLGQLRARSADSPTAVSEAWLLGALGEFDEAFHVLGRAEEEYQGMVSYTGLPGFDPLRGDPRFAALENRLGLPR